MQLRGEKRAFFLQHFGPERLARIERQLDAFSADLANGAGGGGKNTRRRASPVEPYLAQLQRTRLHATPAAAGKAQRDGPEAMLDLLHQPSLWL